MRIVLEITNSLPEGATEYEIGLVLKDALAEYVSLREYGDGAAYVAKRYPGDGVYAGERRIEKVASVIRRCKLAGILRGYWTLTVERVQPSKRCMCSGCIHGVHFAADPDPNAEGGQ